MTDRTLPFRHAANPPTSDEDALSTGESQAEPPSHEYSPRAPSDFLAERPRWMSYLFAVGLASFAIGLRKSIEILGEGIAPFILFFPVVLLSALLGGLGPGVVALVISATAATFLWLKPEMSLALSDVQSINLILFIAANVVNIYLAHRLRSAHSRLRKSEARLGLAQEVGRIGIWDLDLKTGALWWSPSFYKVTGISPAQPPSVEALLERIDVADREGARAMFDAAREGHARLDIDFRLNRDDGTTIWLAGRAELFRDAQGRPARLLGINFDATPVRSAETERDRANSLLETFFASLPGAAFAKDHEGRYMLGNPRFSAAIGHAEEAFLGRTDLELLADPEQARAVMANDRAIMAEGTARHVEEELLLPNGEMSYWLSVKAPFADARGRAQGIMGISLDVTDRRRAEERLRFLADEVDHRARNLLGVVLSLVRLTKVDDVASFKAAVSGRIEALARAHTLLAANRWHGVSIGTLLREEIAPFGAVDTDRIQLAGPPVMLEPNAAQALAMALHELAINAAMHGALSGEEGRLDVAWDLHDGEEGAALVLDWRESGGPPVQSPAKPGFGATAIKGAIEHQLGGTFDLDWASTGLVCSIAFPLSGNLAGDASLLSVHREERPSATEPTPGVPLEGKRVLILEDEALITLTLMEAVRELGCKIVGPASTVTAALELVRQNPPDLAILDVNLAGTGSAPVAQALHALRVPFVYCTGYAEPALQIDPELIAPMLTKPIDNRELAAALRGAGGRQPATCH